EAIAFDQFADQLAKLGGLRLNGVSGADLFLSTDSQLSGGSKVIQKCFYRCRDSQRIARWHQAKGWSLACDFTNSSHGRGDDRQAGSHALEHRVWHLFGK